jgi:hypothetical protein
MNIDMKKVAMVEALIAAGLLYTAGTSNSLIAKTFCFSGAAYLAYGSYLNTQGRVQLLPKGESK